MMNYDDKEYGEGFQPISHLNPPKCSTSQTKSADKSAQGNGQVEAASRKAQ